MSTPAISSAVRSPEVCWRTMSGGPPCLPSMLANGPTAPLQCAGADATRWPPRAVTLSHHAGKAGRPCGAHPALGKLPAAPAGAAAEEHLIAVHQHDADVAAKTVRIDDVAHVAGQVCHRARPP